MIFSFFIIVVPSCGTLSLYFCSVKTNEGGTIMNNNITNIVNCGDRICATLDCNGRCLASVNGMNFASLDAVKRALINLAGHFAGMAILTVRNCTQGWRDVSSLATMRRAATIPQPATTTAPHVGAQYIIPWAS